MQQFLKVFEWKTTLAKLRLSNSTIIRWQKISHFHTTMNETIKTYPKLSFVFWLKQCEKILQQKPHIQIVLLWTNSRLSMSLSILSLASDRLHVRQHSANKEGISNRQIENLRGFKIKPHMTEILKSNLEHLIECTNVQNSYRFEKRIDWWACNLSIWG